MIAPVDATVSKASAPTYQIKVVLLGTNPAVWRTLKVPGDANLAWLHAVLQTAMGWTNSHLHHFLTLDGCYAPRGGHSELGGDLDPPRDEAKATLQQIAPSKGVEFGYEYDFGDSWEHAITVERILPPGNRTLAVCVDGAGACPPEDCGGVPGYAELLKALRNPKHSEHASMKEWLGREFVPGFFDREETNRWLGKLKWPKVTEAQLRKVLMGRDKYTEA